MEKIVLGSVKLIEVVDKIAKTNNFKKYQVGVKEQTEFTGDNHSSKTINAQIIEDGDESKQLNLFIKVSNTPENYRQFFPVEKFFQREVAAYQTVLPELIKFRDQHGAKTDFPFNVAKFYDGGVKFLEEYVIMEDIMFSNEYKMRKKEDILDYKHANCIMRCLANYHAISFAMAAKDPARHEKLREHVSSQFNFPDNTAMMLKNILSKVTPHMPNETTREATTEFGNRSKELLDRALDSNATAPYNVIAHGDCWNNNILFKYKGDEMETLFVDFQFIRYSSPAADLVYLFNISSNKEFRTQYFKQLCDDYYNALGENLHLYGCDVNKLYPREVFDKHLIHTLPLGISFALINSALLSQPGREGALEDLLKGDTSKFLIKADDSILKTVEDTAEDIIANEVLIGN